jgi:transposase-like protein
MTWWVFGSVSAAMVRLTCPHCGEAQMRGKRPLRESYSCRKCYRLFTGAEGLRRSKKRRSRRREIDPDDE